MTTKSQRKRARPPKYSTGKLEPLRLHEGLTKAELARRAGVSASTIRDAEKGNRPISEVMKHKIVNGLNRGGRLREEPYTVDEVFEQGGR